MGEAVNVLVALAVIIFVFRFFTSGDGGNDQTNAVALGFRPKHVTPDMINTVANMFPDIPHPNIHYDLLRTGSVEATTNKILERGFLEAPPQAYHTLYTQPNAANNNTAQRPARPNQAAGPSKPAQKPASLIEKYQLQERVQKGEAVDETQVGGKAQWEDDPAKREASLRERKAQMILAARQRMLAQQQKQSEKAVASS